MSDSLEKRAQQAEKIKNQPELYKVCEGCESIVSRKAGVCPSCHAYRFDESPERVIEQATILGSREQTTVILSDFS